MASLSHKPEDFRLSAGREAGLSAESSSDTRPLLLLGALMAASAIAILYLGRGTTFYYDEWEFVDHRFGGGLDSLLQPHNEHLSLVPVAIYKILFHVAGLNHYPVYRVGLVLLDLLCAGLLYKLLVPRLGRWAALLPAGLFLGLGAASREFLWPFQIGFQASVAAGLVALLLLQRNDRKGDVGASVAVGISLASSGLGLPFAFGIAVELAWTRGWRRLWVAAAPFALYLLWYASYGKSTVTGQSILRAPPWIMDEAAAAAGALLGRGLDWGRPLALVLAICLAGWVITGRALSARLAGSLAIAAVFWILTGLSRSTIAQPDSARYQYLGALVLVLIGSEMLAGRRWSPRALGVGAAITAIGLLAGVPGLYYGASSLRQPDEVVAAELGALQLEAAYAPPGYQPDPTQAPQLTAGPYLHAVKAIGSSPADSPARIAAASSQARAAADRVLVALTQPRPLGPPSDSTSDIAPAPMVQGAAGATVRPRGDCILATPAGPNQTLTLTVPAGGVLIRDGAPGPAGLLLRRWGDTFVPLPAPIPGGSSRALVLADASRVPWHLRVVLPGPVSVCGLSA